MRAYEFITENEFHNWHKDAVPGLKALSDDNYYELYRLGISMAGVGRERETLGTGDTPATDCGLTLSYTQEDEDIINAALRKNGHTAKQVTPNGSKEPKDTQTKSPVANLGPIKRKN